MKLQWQDINPGTVSGCYDRISRMMMELYIWINPCDDGDLVCAALAVHFFALVTILNWLMNISLVALTF